MTFDMANLNPQRHQSRPSHHSQPTMHIGQPDAGPCSTTANGTVLLLAHAPSAFTTVHRLIMRGVVNVAVCNPHSDSLRFEVHGSDLIVVLTNDSRARDTVNRFTVAASRPALYTVPADNSIGGALVFVLPRASQLANRYG